MEVPSWTELVTLMGHVPEPEPTVRGTIRSVDGSDEARRYHASVWQAGTPLPVLARHGVGEAYDVWRDGRRVRMQRPDGAPLLIVGEQWCWQFAPGGDVTVSPVPALSYGGRGTDLLWHQDISRLFGPYARRPLGPVAATTFLERPAWTVRIGPPPGKEFESLWVVDAETGLLLADVNETLGSVDEWTALTVGEALDPALFTYDGPATTDDERQAARMSEHDMDMHRRREWFEAHVAALPLRVELESTVLVHEWDEATGAFQASLGDHSYGSLARRPRSDELWQHGFHGDVVRWSDERWDWALRTDEPLTAGGMESLQRQLSGYT